MTKFLPWLKKHKLNWYHSLLIGFFVLTYAILNLNLGRDALFDWDEGIYAQLGAELIKSKNLFVNTWNYQLWFEKPPGISWLSALGQVILGHSALGARLLMPLVATATLYAIYLLGKQLKNYRVGMMASGFLLSFNLFLARTRAVNVDMALLLGIILTIYFTLRHRPVWQVALTIAFSVWFKGLAGGLALLLALPLILSYYRSDLVKLAIYLVILLLPWHLYVYLRYGQQFLQPYLWEQVVSRVVNPLEFHLESRWFYFTYLYQNLGLGVIVVVGTAFFVSLISYWQHRQLKPYFILAWWLILPLTIFTLAKTRLFWYILPVYPAIALILALFIDSFDKDKKSRQLLTWLAIGVMFQGLYSAYLSVEPHKRTVVVPDRLQLAQQVAITQFEQLLVLVPPSERIAQAILPVNQRISSSFRYGGMPALVFYSQKPTKFFYDVDKFKQYWQDHPQLPAIISTQDKDLLNNYQVKSTTKDYLLIYQN